MMQRLYRSVVVFFRKECSTNRASESILLTRIARGLHDGFYLRAPTCLFRDVSVFGGEE